MRKWIALVSAVLLSLTVAITSTGTASATTYYGTIFCTGGTNGGNVVGVWIEQPGGSSGWANFTNTGGGNATWNYNFSNDNNYQINVGCGGTAQNWYSNNKGPWVKPSWASHDYICDVARKVCALS